MNAEEIREKFIKDNAEFLLDELKLVLRGEGEFSSKSGIWLTKAFESISGMIDNASDQRLVDAKTSSDIIELVKKGKLSYKQARELLDLMQREKDMQAGGTSNLVMPVMKYVLHTPQEPQKPSKEDK